MVPRVKVPGARALRSQCITLPAIWRDGGPLRYPAGDTPDGVAGIGGTNDLRELRHRERARTQVLR